MTSRRDQVTLRWGRVSYLRWESTEPAAPDVLLLHGGGVDSAALSWGELGPALAASGYRVTAPDHPGYGQSPPAPWRATQERLVAYVGEFADAVGLSDHVVGGLSLGGGLTLGHVLARPTGVRGAMLFGSYGLMDHMNTGPLTRPLHLLSWVTLRLGVLGAAFHAMARSRTLMRAGMPYLLGRREARTPALLDELMAAAHGASISSFAQWQRDQFLADRLRTNYTDRLPTLGVPTLIVHGERDAGVPVAFARRAAEFIPDADLLVVPGAAHWVQRDRPDLVTPRVLEFLGRLG